MKEKDEKIETLEKDLYYQQRKGRRLDEELEEEQEKLAKLEEELEEVHQYQFTLFIRVILLISWLMEINQLLKI